jgi:hypothetical protein
MRVWACRRIGVCSRLQNRPRTRRRPPDFARRLKLREATSGKLSSKAVCGVLVTKLAELPTAAFEEGHAEAVCRVAPPARPCWLIVTRAKP